MHTNFGGRDFFGFGDTATFKNGQFSLSDHGLYHGHQKIHRSESAQKIHASINSHQKCDLSLVSEILLPSKMPIFPFRQWTKSMAIKKFNRSELVQKKLDETCMHTNFGGRALSGFGDIATFKNGQISLSDHGL